MSIAKTVPVGLQGEDASACDVVFAILAHNNAICLEQQLGILQRFAPASKCIVFDASTRCHVTDALGIAPCAGSRRLEYARIAPFHISAMRAAAELGSYEFLITLDSDTLLIRPGIGSYLRRVMKDADYMAPHFREASWWLRSDSHRRFRYCWSPYWRTLLGTPTPYRALNCFQVFRKHLVQQFLTLGRMDEIVEATMPGRTALTSLEELVYPTLAVSLGRKAITYPGSYAISTSSFDVSELIEFENDPNVTLVHKVTPEVDSPDWRFVQALSNGIEPEPQLSGRQNRGRTIGARAQSVFERLRGDAKVLSAVVRSIRY